MAIEKNPAQPTELLTGSVDDYLLALADGIHKAQRQLSQLSITVQPGQPAITYQLPKVDFEFRVAFELRTVKGAEGAPAGNAIRLRPAGGESGGRRAAGAEAASIIKGSFVAVPALGGKPPPIVTTQLETVSNRQLRILVLVVSTAGEKLAGVPVEFNIDRELSRLLNEAENLGALSPKTDLWHVLSETDADGKAESVLVVDEQEPVGKQVAVLVDVLQETTIINFKVGD